ncbi:MAG TPA: hypothetical protein VFB84_00475 [Micromonosporaceae bacterium]|nr:hypothetical protein [Micromonosporaceae bacterium]
MTRVVGVHGIGNYAYYRRAGSAEKATAEISRDWMSWLRTGLPAGTSIDLTVAYYAHYLHRGTPQGAFDDPAALEPAAQQMLITWVEQRQPHPQMALGPQTIRARQAADWLTRRFGRAARLAAVAFCREAHAYLANPGSPRRKAAREGVAAAITTHQPQVVIAHSLGSVVVYETLWAHPEISVAMLVTLGSPLGMRHAVFDRLQPAPDNGRGARPPGVASWTNLADVGDIVAVPRDLPGRFDGITRHVPDLTIGDWDFHSIRNYLACPATVEVLLS